MKALLDGAQTLGLKLTAKQLEAFQIYYQELMAWNQRVNLTAITDYEEVQIKHFLDSLTCLLALPSEESLSVVDVGTGAGFPGLPLKIVRPGWRVTLLESVGKKVAFLRHLVERLELEGVEVVKGRAEEVGHDPAHRAHYDVALARAVAELPVLVEYALPLCRVGGLFVAQKGARIEEEVEGARGAMEILGGRLKGVRALRLPTLDGPRHLVIMEKIAPTPERYPRRPGIPAKRPLR
ncbi:MAG TPA: 16S rRNA (guanine(527)-N(7))-methyltransferase RsmG [Anaerolineae bacterium]|nr:16S rRNA (guanine(527)-N(7))-methyltransferase RsmG [Anaerolineae bacterium]